MTHRIRDLVVAFLLATSSLAATAGDAAAAPEYDFGVVSFDDEVAHHFEFTNPGTESLERVLDEVVAAVRAIVAEDLAARASARHAAMVAPTVEALRAKAVEVVEAELARLAGKLGEIDDRTRAEIAQAMHRVMDKLLHAPTVRVKELAGSPGGG